MLESQDYKAVLNEICETVIIAEPVRNNGLIVDFTISFLNNKITDATIPSFFNNIREGQLLSSFRHDIPGKTDWYTIAVSVVEKGKCAERDVFSDKTQRWFHAALRKTQKDLCVCTITDITDSKVKDVCISISQHRDTQTGLLKRECFYKKLAGVIENAQEHNSPFGVALFDIDNLKFINAATGHNSGDKLIQKAAAILASHESDFISLYRLGGDEFVLVQTNLPALSAFERCIKKIFLEFCSNQIAVSIGASVFPEDGTTASALLKSADLATQQVKNNGKNDYAFFHPELFSRFHKRRQLQTKISLAMENKLFELYFQPQFNIETDSLRGFEALIRWHDSENGWIKPDDFIPVAEETNIIILIGKWVIETAVATLKKWQTDYGFTGIISINLSPTQLTQPDFMSDLTELISKYNIPPSSLEFEITERVLIQNIGRTVSILNQIRELGIYLALDDFGTGYASLRYLQMLPLNTLKMDKSFIMQLNSHDKENSERIVVQDIISLVTKRGLSTIAEGVEEQEQLSELKSMHCRYIQGFLWGKPMNAKRCGEFLSGDFSALDRIGTEAMQNLRIKEVV